MFFTIFLFRLTNLNLIPVLSKETIRSLTRALKLQANEQIKKKHPEELFNCLRNSINNIAQFNIALNNLVHLNMKREDIPADVIKCIGERIIQFQRIPSRDFHVMFILQKLGLNQSDFDDATVSHMLLSIEKSIIETPALVYKAFNVLNCLKFSDSQINPSLLTSIEIAVKEVPLTNKSLIKM